MTILDYNGTTLFTFFAVNGDGSGNATILENTDRLG